MQPRNLFTTKTVLVTLASAALSLTAALTPVAESYFTRRAETDLAREDIKDFANGIRSILGILGVGASGFAIKYRYDATGDTYTPDWMGEIGRNKDEIPRNLPLEQVSGDVIGEEPKS